MLTLNNCKVRLSEYSLKIMRGEFMYRIAVIQNEVEMQHSGYVDSVPKYRKQNFDLKEHVFNRFSSVNIRNLFIEGEDFLLDYDCLIIGTNATSDDDVYTILCEEGNKNLLAQYISMGKGLLICSQKKFRKDDEADDSEYNARKTFFLPETYEYKVISRPKGESSTDGTVIICDQKLNNIQKFISSYPRVMKNETIEERCQHNDFQKHYYRDFIIPVNDSAYFPVLLDNRRPVRNTLMVACPQKNEKIVISTMALDWAGHYELIENILYYLIIGIPSVAFVNKRDVQAQDFEFLISEADLSKISYVTYSSLENVLNGRLRQYHTLYVFSSTFPEEEVASFWEEHIKPQTEYIKLFYYKYINRELVLVNFSYYSYIDTQKREVETWLKSKYQGGMWDNSFWKTYDALLALHNMGISISGYLKSIFMQIYQHYKSGSYDGVLAPTCGLLELEALIIENDEYRKAIPEIDTYYEETKGWLINKYKGTSSYNKKFIVRSFYNAKRLPDLSAVLEDFNRELHDIALDDTSKDKLEIDLCLDVDVCLIYVNEFEDRKDVKNRIRDCTDCILKNQMQNGRWDNNLGKTARLLVFFLKHQAKQEFEHLEKEVGDSIDRGITALRNAYEKNNWENNIVTTSNAITAIIEYDKAASYKSKDFLNQVSKEAKLADSYNSLLLALRTIDRLTKKYGESTKRLIELKDVQRDLESNKAKLSVATTIASVSILLLVSYYIFLYLKNPILFKSMLMESLMWIPIVIGIAITSIVGFLPKLVTRTRKRKE